MLINFPDTEKEATALAMDNPQIGDRYQEMFSFWMFVVGREDDVITTLEAAAPCSFPEDGKARRFDSLEAFREHWGYGTAGLGYWVRLSGRGYDVGGWLDVAERKLRETAKTEEVERLCPCCGRAMEKW